MRNLWIAKWADGHSTRNGANDFVELKVRYKKNGASKIAVDIAVRYNNGQPVIIINGDPTCNWSIGGRVDAISKRNKDKVIQEDLFDPPV